jgi:uncharacterized delta-60 repeat protein
MAPNYQRGMEPFRSTYTSADQHLFIFNERKESAMTTTKPQIKWLSSQQEMQSPQNASSSGKATAPLPLLEYDTTFGVNGKLKLPFNEQQGWVSCAIPSTAKADTFLAVYYQTSGIPQPTQYHANIARFDRNGVLDISFGPNQSGYIEVVLPPGTMFIIRGAHESETGNITIWGSTLNFASGTETGTMMRFLSNGAVDSRFGLNGVLNLRTLLAPANGFFVRECVFNVDGSLFAPIIGLFEDTQTSYIVKMTDAGKLDSSFGDGGMLKFDNLMRHSISNLTRVADKKFIASGYLTNDVGLRDGWLMRFDENGLIDESFGNGGAALITSGDRHMDPQSVEPSSDKYVISGNRVPRGEVGHQGMLAVYSDSGQPDPEFNGGIPRFDDMVRGDLNKWNAALFLSGADNKIVAVGEGGTYPTSIWPVVGRFTSDGKIDDTFASTQGFGTLSDAVFFSTLGYGVVNTTPHQLLIAGADRTDGRPAILAIKV